MNIERLATIAEWLEAGAPHKDGVDGFDMSDWRKESACGTTCCIGGAAHQFFGAGGNVGIWSIAQSAARLLGLDERQSNWLFFAFSESEGIPYSKITPDWAARCIRKLIATGEVDWEGTRNSGASTSREEVQ